MTQSNVVEFGNPEGKVDDALTEVLRVGARKLLPQAVEAEVEAFPRLNGSKHFADVIRGVQFKDGIKVNKEAT